MTARSWMNRITQQEGLNFLLTNRIPRRGLTLFVGWLSRIENPLVCALCIRAWRLFSDLDLSEAKQPRFKSLRDCFTRELKDGSRPIDADPEVLVSPCDGLVGALGDVVEGQVMQAKGFGYSLHDLLGDDELVRYYRDGRYATLRLTSSMYHRFHAPYGCRVEQVNYISGDTWNVNPIALKRIERLFCRNERAVIRCRAGRCSRWCRWPRFWSRAFACASWTSRCTCATGARTSFPATSRSPRARRWAGSSTDRPSSSSRRAARNSAKAFARAPGSAWGRR